jgi:hypothetical protein
MRVHRAATVEAALFAVFSAALTFSTWRAAFREASGELLACWTGEAAPAAVLRSLHAMGRYASAAQYWR